MATYNQVSYGSRGSGVTELQKLLNQNGYGLDEDGVFGSKTQNAVRDYQQKNGLSVDGIVGNQTWGALTTPKQSAQQPTQPAQTTQETQATQTPKYPSYVQSDAVKKAEELLQQQISQKPGDYTSKWQGQLDAIMDKIMNREKFSYDLNGDMLYQQYKDQYVNGGKLAMLDTMGQAQAMTGGYGNSYAQSVGQQAYQGYLQKLNDVVPDLYNLALSKYNQDGQDLMNQFSMLGDREQQDYSRYQDALTAYYNDLDRLYNRYNTERDLDYNRFADDRNFQYQQDRDAESDRQWQAQFDEAKRQYDEQYAAARSSGGSGGSGGGGGGYSSGDSSSGSSGNGGYSDDIVKFAQRVVGVAQDGNWGAQSQAAAQAKGYKNLSEIVDRYRLLEKNLGGTQSTYSGSKSVPTKGLNDYSVDQYRENTKNGEGGYTNVLNDLRAQKNAGASNDSLAQYLSEAVGNSFITRSEYIELMQKVRNGKI